MKSASEPVPRVDKSKCLVMATASSTALRRIRADVMELSKNPSPLYHAAPLEEDVFEWHFTVRGPTGTEFAGGVYHGRILLPPEYPFKPPSILLLTPNGRFEVNTKICLSLTAHHPEHWQPAWGVRTILEALVAFFPTPADASIGALQWRPDERRALATKSRDWQCPQCGKIRLLVQPEQQQQQLSRPDPDDDDDDDDDERPPADRGDDDDDHDDATQGPDDKTPTKVAADGATTGAADDDTPTTGAAADDTPTTGAADDTTGASSVKEEDAAALATSSPARAETSQGPPLQEQQPPRPAVQRRPVPPEVIWYDRAIAFLLVLLACLIYKMIYYPGDDWFVQYAEWQEARRQAREGL